MGADFFIPHNEDNIALIAIFKETFEMFGHVIENVCWWGLLLSSEIDSRPSWLCSAIICLQMPIKSDYIWAEKSKLNF